MYLHLEILIWCEIAFTMVDLPVPFLPYIRFVSDNSTDELSTNNGMLFKSIESNKKTPPLKIKL